MPKHLLIFCCLSAVLLTSCHTGRKTTAHHSRQPKFIDDIYMDRHNKNIAHTNAMDKSQPYPEKKYTGRTHSTKATAPKLYASNNKTCDINPNAKYTPVEFEGLKQKYAGMLKVGADMIDNFPLFHFIEEWYGTDYQRGGCTKDGVDCSGFVQKLFGEVFGMDLTHNSGEMFSNCDMLKKTQQPAMGDLVFFKIHSRRISHVGVYLMNDYFVHASSSQGVTISNLNDEYWQRYLAGVGRVRKG